MYLRKTGWRSFPGLKQYYMDSSLSYGGKMKYIIPTKEQEKTLYDVVDFPLEDSLKPVFNYRFYHAIIYCNDLSIKEGLMPCYYLDNEPVTILTDLYDRIAPNFAINWEANGYRLPTLDEYRKEPPNNPCWAWDENGMSQLPIIHYKNGEELIYWTSADDHNERVTFYMVKNK